MDKYYHHTHSAWIFKITKNGPSYYTNLGRVVESIYKEDWYKEIISNGYLIPVTLTSFIDFFNNRKIKKVTNKEVMAFITDLLINVTGVDNG